MSVFYFLRAKLRRGKTVSRTAVLFRKTSFFSSDCSENKVYNNDMEENRKHAYWIHQKKEAPESVKGYFYLPQCSCSNCGAEVNREKTVCPNCMALMDLEAPKEDE